MRAAPARRVGPGQFYSAFRFLYRLREASDAQRARPATRPPERRGRPPVLKNRAPPACPTPAWPRCSRPACAPRPGEARAGHDSGCGTGPGASVACQRRLHDGLGVDLERVEQGHRAVLRSDQEGDLRAAQHDALGAARAQALDDLHEAGTGFRPELLPHELLHDGVVEVGPVRGVRDEGGEALRRQALGVEASLHGGQRAEQFRRS